MQQEIIRALNVKKEINPKEEIHTRVTFLKDYARKAKSKGFVLGISGGQDSALSGRLCQIAVEELRQEGYDAKFIAMRLPYQVQRDANDADTAIDFIKPDRVIEFNIAGPVTEICREFEKSSGEAIHDYHKGNTKARTRMLVQYAVGGQYGLLVVGTDHAAENVTGFYTKFGDGGADIVPIYGLNKRQGRALLQEMNAPASIYLKIPTADLLDNKPGQADEYELGITYELIDDYLEGKQIPPEIAEKIEKIYKGTQHKRFGPVTCYDTWWK